MSNSFFEAAHFGLNSDKNIYINQPFSFGDFNLNPEEMSVVLIEQIFNILELVPEQNLDSVIHSLKYEFKFYLIPIEKNSSPMALVDSKLSKKAIQFLLKNSSSTLTLSDIFIDSYLPKTDNSFNFLSFIKNLELHKFFKKTFFNFLKFISIKIFIFLLLILIPSLKQFLQI